MAEITQAQYSTAKQGHRNISIRIDLLNFSKQVIESIEGRVIGGTLTSDANSNMRNTCDIKMVITDSSFSVEAEGKIWMDRYIQIYVGVEDVHTNQIVWTNKGIYLLNQPTYEYDAESNTLSFQGVDMMALLTDMRGGILTEAYVIPAGSNVRDVIITILSANGFNEYVVVECENSDGSIQPVPYDMNFDIGSTWWDVLEALQSILPNYQMYFDVDGVFHYEPTPYKSNEVVRMDDDIWRQNVISENVAYDFESVKNSVKVLGRTHSVNYFATDVTVSDATINLTIPNFTEMTNGALIGFALTQSVYGNIMLNVNNLGAVKLSKLDGRYVTSLAKGEYWTASYDSDNQSWQFLGHVQAVGEWMDDNPHSPFFVGNPAGEIKIVLYGGEYDNIMSDELATQRAEWEIYQRCRMNDSITLTSVPIYWSEVNWMVAYTPLGQDVVNQYLIRSITTDLTHDGTQTYNLIRWYPYYIQYIPAIGDAIIYVNLGATSYRCPSAIAAFSKNVLSENGTAESDHASMAVTYNKYVDINGLADAYAAAFPHILHETPIYIVTGLATETKNIVVLCAPYDINADLSNAKSAPALAYNRAIKKVAKAQLNLTSYANFARNILELSADCGRSYPEKAKARYRAIKWILCSPSRSRQIDTSASFIPIKNDSVFGTADFAELNSPEVDYDIQLSDIAMSDKQPASNVFINKTIQNNMSAKATSNKIIYGDFRDFSVLVNVSGESVAGIPEYITATDYASSVVFDVICASSLGLPHELSYTGTVVSSANIVAKEPSPQTLNAPLYIRANGNTGLVQAVYLSGICGIGINSQANLILSSANSANTKHEVMSYSATPEVVPVWEYPRVISYNYGSVMTLKRAYSIEPDGGIVTIQ